MSDPAKLPIRVLWRVIDRGWCDPVYYECPKAAAMFARRASREGHYGIVVERVEALDWQAMMAYA